jgi:callose synthase
LETQDKVAEKTEILVPYNILPLDPDSANQAIMKFPEVGSVVSYEHNSETPIVFLKLLVKVIIRHSFQIQAAVLALRNTRGLAWPKDYKKKKDEDILDWLGAMYGFQVNYNLDLVVCLRTS